MSSPEPGRSLRTLVVGGAPRSRGRHHGEELRGLVAEGIGRWSEEVERRTGRSVIEYVDEFLREIRFRDNSDRWVPGALEEIEGIAEGAGIDPRLVLAYNLDDEEYWWSRERHGIEIFGRAPAHCTALAFRSGLGGCPVVAQNMDLATHYDGSQVLLTVVEGASQATFLTAAGILGLCGWSSDGVAVACNSLLDLPHSSAGVPQKLVVRGALRQACAEAAAAWLRRVPHASGQNYVVADAGRVLDLECSSRGAVEYGAGRERFAHANHALSHAAQAVDDMSGSVERLTFAERELDGVDGMADLERILADRTTPVCKHPGRPGDAMTFGSMIVELAKPPRARICIGPAETGAYRAVAPSTGLAAADAAGRQA